MQLKIYFNSKPLFLCDAMNDEISSYAAHDDAIYIDEFSTAAVNSMIHEMRQEKVHAGIFLYEDLNKLKAAFFRKFQLIQAGGGLVENGNQEFLFIYRRNIWDLPKGKLDQGESIETCAVREVKEETGLKDVSIEKHILNSYHVYDENGKHILKQTSWYSMHAKGGEKLIPQTEEQITEIKWVGRNELDEMLSLTYPLIVDVIRESGVLNR